MRCLTVLVMIVLIAIVGITGYNYLQINRIKRDLKVMKGVAHQAVSPTSDQNGLISALVSADRHATLARELLAKGKVKSAQHELDKSLKALNEATAVSKRTENYASESISDAVSKVQKEFQGTLNAISRQAFEKRPEGNRHKSDE